MAMPRFHIVFLVLFLILTGCVSHRDQGLLNTNVNPAAYHYQMGQSFLGERNFTGALIELTEAEKLDPDNPELLYNLGLAYVGKKRPDLALKHFQQAIELKPDYSIARNDLARAFMELKRWDEAIQQLKIVKDDIFYANSEYAAINLGLAYLGKGELTKAFDELSALAASNPGNPVIRVSLGRVFFSMDKTEQAVTEYQKALQIFKDYGAAYYYLGLAQLKQNKPDEARKSFKEVLRILPESDLGRLSVGYLELIK